MTRTLIAISCAAGAAACIVHRPQRTFDYADVTAHPPAGCDKLQPPAQDRCGPNYPTDAEVAAAPDKPRRASNSSVCTTLDELKSTGSIDEYNRTGTAGSSVAACFSHERYPDPAAGPNPARPLYDLHIVEFDDEGQPWNAEREDETLRRLEQDLKDPAIVVTFIHGWKNSAEVCNGNLACFREVLEVLAKAERMYASLAGEQPRRIIGVYIGWRGGTFSVEPLETGVTFWGRKHTAHVIGDNGGVTSLIRRIRTIVEAARAQQRVKRSGWNVPDRSHVIIGHSFGGALLLSALSTSLNGSIGQAVESSIMPTEDPQTAAIRMKCDAASDAVPPPVRQESRGQSSAQPLLGGVRPVYVETQGDLVLLVNPATEGSRFANLNSAVHVPFSRCQVPMFVTLASEADLPVGTFFPIGQSLATLARSARSREAWFSMEEGMGLFKPYHTHRLVPRSADDMPAKDHASGRCECESNLRAHGDELLNRLKPFYERIASDATPASPPELQLAAYQEFLYSRLEPIQDIDPNNPFMTVRVDARIVGGHSDLFNIAFLDFVIEFVVKTEIKRELVNMFTQGQAR